jgi:hypothetical protein
LECGFFVTLGTARLIREPRAVSEVNSTGPNSAMRLASSALGGK